MPKKKLTYKNALAELESIVAEIEHGEPDIDQLGLMIKKAVELVEFCKESLRTTDTQIDDALKTLED